MSSTSSAAGGAAAGGGRARPHIVIIGGGFAGLSAARALRSAPVRITLVDRTNHHLFQPLLYQAATSSLAPSDIASPIRSILRRQRNVTVLLADVKRIEPARRTVALEDGSALAYDFLIVAAGIHHDYFGHPEWEQHAPGLKSLEDAIEIKHRTLLAFERAERCDDPAERQALLTFVVVGGGPTGMELAGQLPEIARRAMHDDFRRIDPSRAHVILVEAGPRILPAFPEELSARARRDLEALGVEVRTGRYVTGIDAGGVTLGDERIPTYTVLWAAGNVGSPLARTLGAPLDAMGRVRVRPDLSVPGHPELFVVGDLANVEYHGEPIPGVAPAANQEGRHAARQILRTLRGDEREPFAYFDKGMLATIGRNHAVAAFGPLRFGGVVAWLLWLFVHILYLVGFRNRVSVLLHWIHVYVTRRRTARIILGAPPGTVHEAGVEPLAAPRWPRRRASA
jgi:NADH dehydrogenase